MASLKDIQSVFNNLVQTTGKIAATSAIEDANQRAQEIRGLQIDEKEKMEQLKNLANEVAVSLFSTGADPSTVEGVKKSLAPEPSVLEQRLELLEAQNQFAFEERVGAEAFRSAETAKTRTGAKELQEEGISQRGKETRVTQSTARGGAVTVQEAAEKGRRFTGAFLQELKGERQETLQTQAEAATLKLAREKGERAVQIALAKAEGKLPIANRKLINTSIKTFRFENKDTLAALEQVETIKATLKDPSPAALSISKRALIKMSGDNRISNEDLLSTIPNTSIWASTRRFLTEKGIGESLPQDREILGRLAEAMNMVMEDRMTNAALSFVDAREGTIGEPSEKHKARLLTSAFKSRSRAAQIMKRRKQTGIAGTVVPPGESVESVATLPGQFSPEQVAQQKPRIQNPDGSVSTERSITIGVDDGFINIPTIVNGRQLTADQAIEASKTDGIQRQRFGTIAEAEKAAQQRSDAIGRALQQAPIVYKSLNEIPSVAQGGPEVLLQGTGKDSGTYTPLPGVSVASIQSFPDDIKSRILVNRGAGVTSAPVQAPPARSAPAALIPQEGLRFIDE